jgi:hypothetical protein
MLSAFVSYVWASGVIIGAILTLVFLTLIRLYSRATDPNALEKVTEKLGDKIGDVKEEVGSLVEGYLTSTNGNKGKEKSGKAGDTDNVDNKPIPIKTSTLDLQFYGELFLASLLSGLVIKAGW